MLFRSPPGGVTDIAARLVAPKMAEQFGQPVVVENIAAAGGVVATNALAKAAPDGYTLGVVFDSFATNPFLYKGVAHDPVRDFVPVSLMVRSPQLLVVNPASGIRSMAEFLRAAKEQVPYGINRYSKEKDRLYGVLNRRLGEAAFLAGDYSIADIATYPWVARYEWHKTNLEDHPNVNRWFKDVSARAAVIKGMAVPG